MKDLTQGSILRQIVGQATPIAIGMLVQTLYLLVDLYFVGRLGDAALAGVSAAGNILYIVMALAQMLGVGTVSLMAVAVGRKDRQEANLVFNQSLLMAAVCLLLTLAGGYGCARSYLQSLGADAATMQMGLSYLYCFLPGLALQFAMTAMGSALRATGVVKPAMVVQLLTVLINAILAPVLIAGWGTGHALGVAGAGLASTLSIAAGVVMVAIYYGKLETYVSFDARQMAPRWQVWKRLLNIGFPAGAEFACLFIFIGLVYGVISQFGAAAMAGFGVGSRIMQAIFLPGMALAFALPAIAGQNLGAGSVRRVRDTIRLALYLECAVMLLLTVACKLLPDTLARLFTDDARSVAFAADYLRIISWNFVATGIVYACSGLFQAFGNTWPGLLSTVLRVLAFGIPALWMAQRPGFAITQLWYWSAATVALQAVLSLSLLRWAWRRRKGSILPAAAVGEDRQGAASAA